MTNKNILIAICIAFAFTGCGDKIVKMNEYKDISYSYHPHASYGLESSVYEMILDDSTITKKKERLAEKLNKDLDTSLNEIISNKGNSNIMTSTQNEKRIPKRSNGIFNDRFDALRLNR